MNKHLFIILVLSTIMVFASLSCASAYNIIVPTNCYLTLGNGCYINFASQQTFTTLQRIGSIYYFGSYGLTSSASNITVSALPTSSNLFTFTSSGGSAASTIQVYAQGKGTPQTVSPVTSYTFDSTTDFTTIQLSNPNATVTLDWSKTNIGGGGGGGADSPTPTPTQSSQTPAPTDNPDATPTSQPINIPTLNNMDTQNLVVVAVIALLGIVLAMLFTASSSQNRNKRPKKHGDFKIPSNKKKKPNYM